MTVRAVLSALLVAFSTFLHAQTWAWDDGSVPFVVTPDEVVERMLRMAEVGPGDFLIDLGSGDGRVVIEAARRGARGLGVDIDPELVERSAAAASEAGVAGRARFEVRDLFETDLGAASVVTMYLLPEINLKLMPRLLALRPGTRVVSHDWDMGPWPPDETLEMRTPEKTLGVGGLSRVHLWVVPADLRGTWIAELPGHGGEWRFRVSQRYQVLEVEARAGGAALVVHGSRLRGEDLRLVVTGRVGARTWNHLFRGKVSPGRVSGEVRISDGQSEKTIPWTARRVP